jgi:pyruvate,water dikinase
LDFQEIDQTQVALVGGKGANLGELSRILPWRDPGPATGMERRL